MPNSVGWEGEWVGQSLNRSFTRQVTHNPDIECYADRILYVNDGRFIKQALNYHQTRLVYDDYIKFLNSQEESKGSMIK